MISWKAVLKARRISHTVLPLPRWFFLTHNIPDHASTIDPLTRGFCSLLVLTIGTCMATLTLLLRSRYRKTRHVFTGHTAYLHSIWQRLHDDFGPSYCFFSYGGISINKSSWHRTKSLLNIESTTSSPLNPLPTHVYLILVVVCGASGSVIGLASTSV